MLGHNILLSEDLNLEFDLSSLQETIAIDRKFKYSHMGSNEYVVFQEFKTNN